MNADRLPLASDEQFDDLAFRVSDEGHRVLVIAASREAAEAWMTYREIRARGRVSYVEAAKTLFGVDPASTSIVLVKGYATHRAWRRIKDRLAVARADPDLQVLLDELPAGDAPPTPTVGGCFIGTMGNTAPLPVEEGQGDTFFVRQAGTTIIMNRTQTELLVELMSGWLAGDPMPDPIAERTAAIRAAVQASGDPYARGTE